MTIGVNQFCFPYDVEAALKAAARIGFDTFELCLTDAAAQHGAGGVTDALDISRYHNRLLNLQSSKNDILTLSHIARDVGIRLSGIGGITTFSIYPLTARDQQTAEKSLDAGKKMLDAAQMLGCDTVLLIPGMLTETDEYEPTFRLAQARVAALADYAPGVTIGIENVWNNYLYSPMELCQFVDELKRESVGIYLDLANARRFGYPQQWVRTLGKRIKRLHCKDYRMSIDNINAFTNLLDGDVNYPAVMAALKDIHYDGELVVELIPPARYLVEQSLTAAKQTLEALIKEF